MGESESHTCSVKFGRCVQVIYLESFGWSVAEPGIEPRSPECWGYHCIFKTILPLQSYFRSVQSAKDLALLYPATSLMWSDRCSLIMTAHSKSVAGQICIGVKN